MRKTTALLIGLSAASATLVSPVAAQAAAHDGESFVMTYKTFDGIDSKTHVSASGPVAGSGWSTQTEADTPDGEIALLTWYLPDGTVAVRVDESFQIIPDVTSCTAKGIGTGTWTITGGTGAFAGATGSGSFSDHGSYVGTRDAHGVCDTEAEPRSAIFTVRGDGTADLS